MIETDEVKVRDLRVGDIITFSYINWRDIKDERRALVNNFLFEGNQWHPKPQMIVDAVDLDKMAIRKFAATDMKNIKIINQSINMHLERIVSNE